MKVPTIFENKKTSYVVRKAASCKGVPEDNSSAMERSTTGQCDQMVCKVSNLQTKKVTKIDSGPEREESPETVPDVHMSFVLSIIAGMPVSVQSVEELKEEVEKERFGMLRFRPYFNIYVNSDKLEHRYSVS